MVGRVVMVLLLVALAYNLLAQNAGGIYGSAIAHSTLHGKVAVFSYYDVVKTSEPLLCSDGVVNFTCVISKVDISSILTALDKIGVRPSVKVVNQRQISVLEFNFTSARWIWRSVPVLKGWQLTWREQTLYVFQTPIRYSFGELVKIHNDLVNDFFFRNVLRNITSVAVHFDKLVVGTENGTNGYPDKYAAQRIRDYISRKFPGVRVEVIYMPQGIHSNSKVSMGGDYPIKISVNYPNPSNRTQRYVSIGNCTLGYVGFKRDALALQRAKLFIVNDTSDLRGDVYLKIFDLSYWWDRGYSSVLVKASVGAEWRFERVDGALLDYALFWEDCSYCDSNWPPPVKNQGTLYEDLILRVTYVGGRWVVRVLWGHGGFGHEVYVNGSLLYRKPPGYVGEPGVYGVYNGGAIELKIISEGDSSANSGNVFRIFPVIITAWHCFGFAGTEATSPFSLVLSVNDFTVILNSESSWHWPEDAEVIYTAGGYHLASNNLYVHFDTAWLGLYVRDPSLILQKASLIYGYIRKADGLRDLPIIGQLMHYDVPISSQLWVSLGRSQQTKRGYVTSLCSSWRAEYNLLRVIFICQVKMFGVKVEFGDSGSPVYLLATDRKGVLAYGVQSGKSRLLPIAFIQPVDTMWYSITTRAK